MKLTHWFLMKVCVLSLFVFQQVYLVNGSEENVKLKISPRIIGGRKAKEGEFLGIVSIQTWRNEHFCGGTWFQFGNQSQILTAAHCVVNKEKRLIDKSLLQVMGNDLSISSSSVSQKRQIRKIRKIVPHPYYNPKMLINDIAIIFLATPFEEHKEFAPIELTNKAIFDYQPCSVAGWGYLKQGGTPSTELMATNVSVIPRKICNPAYDGRLGRHVFCSGSLKGGRDACQGDSGGGILSENKIIGIVSSGIGCGLKNYPGLYTNVHHYNHWIRKEINSSSRSILSHLLILTEIAVIVFLYIDF